MPWPKIKKKAALTVMLGPVTGVREHSRALQPVEMAVDCHVACALQGNGLRVESVPQETTRWEGRAGQDRAGQAGMILESAATRLRGLKHWLSGVKVIFSYAE
jgi:hypothetical protein